jgi:hypothetical protein
MRISDFEVHAKVSWKESDQNKAHRFCCKNIRINSSLFHYYA